jgi:hypothetical protein
LRVPSSSRSPDHDPHRTIYYLGYPLGRFAGLKHRQLEGRRRERKKEGKKERRKGKRKKRKKEIGKGKEEK